MDGRPGDASEDCGRSDLWRGRRGNTLNLASIRSGSHVFVDANIFVYSFASDATFGTPCSEFLDRIQAQDLSASISSALLSDVAHRLMTLEACDLMGWAYAGIGRRLRRDVTVIQRLRKHRQALDEILKVVTVVEVTGADVLRAADLGGVHVLLSGDGLILAVMERLRIQSLASNDADFDRIPTITRYSPL